VKSFEVSPDQPVRSAKFVARKQWIVCGSDDMQIRVFNYNTLEKVKVFEAHSDYIRYATGSLVSMLAHFLQQHTDNEVVYIYSLQLNYAREGEGVRSPFGLHPKRYRKPSFDSYPVF